MIPELEKPRVTEIEVRMDCNGCVQKIKKALHGINGIYDIYIDFPQQKLTIIGWADPEKIVKALKKTRKMATICSHSEPATEPAPESGPPPETVDPPPPDAAPPAEANPPAEPPQNPSAEPPENPPPEPTPPSASNDNPTNQAAQPSERKEEVHVIYHHPPDYGYRVGYGPNYGNGYGGSWNSYANTPRYHHEQPSGGSGYRHEPPSGGPRYRYEPPSGGPGYRHEPPSGGSEFHIMPPSGFPHGSPSQGSTFRPELRSGGSGVRYEPQSGYQHEPPQPVYVSHSYNTYRPSPYVTEYEYIHSPPNYTRYSRPERYSDDYHNSNTGNGNITSIFSEENPNACRIV